MGGLLTFLARGGPILAAKISPGSQIRSVHHDQWGDCFWQGGTNFGCQNQSGETDFGCRNWSGGPFFAKIGPGGPLLGGTDFGVTALLKFRSFLFQFLLVVWDEHLPLKPRPIFGILLTLRV